MPENSNPNLWENISISGRVGDTFRMPVPGGWLYRHTTYNDGWSVDTMAFVPDLKE